MRERIAAGLRDDRHHPRLFVPRHRRTGNDRGRCVLSRNAGASFLSERGRVATYEYPRYFFSNLSDDIRRIFCEHCELLGIRWTQSNPRNISISHRRSVALMDEFIGPKC